jgi:hypothetical protein
MIEICITQCNVPTGRLGPIAAKLYQVSNQMTLKGHLMMKRKLQLKLPEQKFRMLI